MKNAILVVSLLFLIPLTANADFQDDPEIAAMLEYMEKSAADRAERKAAQVTTDNAIAAVIDSRHAAGLAVLTANDNPSNKELLTKADDLVFDFDLNMRILVTRQAIDTASGIPVDLTLTNQCQQDLADLEKLQDLTRNFKLNQMLQRVEAQELSLIHI